MISAPRSKNRNAKYLRMSSAKRCSFCRAIRLSSHPKQSLYVFPSTNPMIRRAGPKMVETIRARKLGLLGLFSGIRRFFF